MTKLDYSNRELQLLALNVFTSVTQEVEMPLENRGDGRTLLENRNATSMTPYMFWGTHLNIQPHLTNRNIHTAIPCFDTASSNL